MITIISGTNRKNSLTKIFAKKYLDLLKQETQQEVQLLALEDIPHDWFSASMYQGDNLPESLVDIQEKYILPATSFVVLSPEYNGSYPGMLKLFIDACSVRKYADNFKGKKVALIGVAGGRAGNLRGMTHLASVFNYLGTVTFPNQLPISSIENLLDDEKEVVDQATIKVMSSHAQEFLQFIQ